MSFLGLEGSQQGAEILGVDFAQTADGDLALSHGGLLFTSGEPVALNDIGERVRACRGTEFYDRLFGETLLNWIEAPDTHLNRLQMLIQLETCVEADPRVKAGSAAAEVVAWVEEPRQLELKVSWLWIDWPGHGGNLVLTMNEAGIAAVSSAYRPTSAAGERA